MERETPTLEELQSLRRSLVQQLEKAQELFCEEESTANELVTGRAALACIDELITAYEEQKL